ncbi:hypothetical protein GC106_29090 [Kibdelosporangium sp. 4NS15]|uniref:ABC transporter permease n=1 Tax=Kibdelosporangium persicum TaxID=2698649 RepID=A0ABX2F4B1_9PSEU|nr:hypothetical protein [Kibdelosporangium persicum]
MIELRRSAGLWTGLLIFVISVGLFYALPGPWSKGMDAWTEEWTSLAMWQRWLLNMTWPLALGAGAWQGRRDRRSKMDELLATTSRSPFTRAVPPVAAMCVGVAGAYLAIFLVGAVQVAGNAGYFSAAWLPIMIVGVLSVIAAALAGMGIGRVFPFLLTAPILAVLGLAAMVITLTGGPGTGSALENTVSQQVALLSPVFDPPDVFTTVSAEVNLVQGLWFIGLAVTGFGLLTLAGDKARLLALVPALAALAIALPSLPSQGGVFETDTSAAALVCEDQVCVSRIHEDHLPEVLGPAKQALSQLAKLPGAPTRVEEARMPSWDMDSLPKSADVVYFHFDDWEFKRDSRRTILAGPALARCDTWDKSVVSSAKRTVVASWFDGKFEPVRPSVPPNPEVMAVAEPMWQALQALPADQQPAHVASLRATAREC